MAKPKFRVVAKNKTTKQYVDVGAIFENEQGMSLLLKPGGVIKVATAWDKEAKKEVTLKEPIYIKPEEWFINVRSTDDDRTFRADDNQKEPF